MNISDYREMTFFVLLSVFYFSRLVNNNKLKTVTQFAVTLHLFISLFSSDELSINVCTQEKNETILQGIYPEQY